MREVFLAFVGVAGAWAASSGDWSQLGAQSYAAASYNQAAAQYRQAMETAETPPERITAMGNLGVALRAAGRFDEAEPLLLQALHELESGSPGPGRLGWALNNVAALYHGRGNAAQAEQFALRAADTLRPVAGSTPSEWGMNRQLLASIYVDQRRFAEAEAILRQLLPGADEDAAVAAYNALTAALLAQGRVADAESPAIEAVEHARKSLSPAHPALAAALNNLAQVYRFQKRYPDAERLYREAADISAETRGKQHPDYARVLMNLAAMLRERERYSGAEQYYRRAADILDRAIGPAHPLTLQARTELADVLRAERRYTEGKKVALAALTQLEKAAAPGDPRLARAERIYAQLLAESGARPERHGFRASE
jgi:tetratricopeptide (TPR) repeat protein